MGLLRSLLLGRPDGLRAGQRRRFGGGATAAAPPPVSPVVAAPAPAEAALGLKPEPPRGVTPPDGFEVVLHKDALKPGKVTEIIVGGTAIAVANADGAFHACTNVCPHAGGPLGEGFLDGDCVECPWHGWRYNVKTGERPENPEIKVDRYEVHIEGDTIKILLP